MRVWTEADPGLSYAELKRLVAELVTPASTPQGLVGGALGRLQVMDAGRMTEADRNRWKACQALLKEALGRMAN